MNVIFLAGTHGVGKTFLGKSVAQSLGIAHMTASQLIREAKGYASWSEDKSTSNIDGNQEALIQAVDLCRQQHATILLDGHFALRDSHGRVTSLNSTVFKAMQSMGVIFLTDDSNLIATRLSRRDNTVVSPRAIAELAEEGLAHAQNVCNELGLALSVIHAPTEKTLTDAIKRLLKV